jgi:hypothetical protein
VTPEYEKCDRGAFLPTKIRIRMVTAKFRKTWSEKERRARAGMPREIQGWAPPTVELGEPSFAAGLNQGKIEGQAVPPPTS